MLRCHIPRLSLNMADKLTKKQIQIPYSRLVISKTIRYLYGLFLLIILTTCPVNGRESGDSLQHVLMRSKSPGNSLMTSSGICGRKKMTPFGFIRRWIIPVKYQLYPDRAPLKEVLGGQYNYREGGRQVLRQGAKGRWRS